MVSNDTPCEGGVENNIVNIEGVAEGREVAVVPPPFRVEPHLEFIEIGTDGSTLLGSSNLVGKFISGSVWCFRDADHAPDKSLCISGYLCSSAVGVGKLLGTVFDPIIIGEDNGAVSILNVTDVEGYHIIPEVSTTCHCGPVSCMSVFENKEKFVSGGSDKSLIVWETNTLTALLVYRPAHGRPITAVDTVNDTDGHTLFASSSLDGNVLLWDTRLSKPASALYSDERKCQLRSVAWKSSDEVVVGTQFGELIVVDVRGRLESSRHKVMDRPIHRISFNNAGLLAVCGDKNVVQVFDFDQKSIVYSDDKHQGFVRGLSWNPIRNNLYSSGFDKQVFSHIVGAL